MNFRGEYSFLSNMYPCKVTIPIGDKVYTFKCSEAAYQGLKCIKDIHRFIPLDGKQAKALGKKLPMRKGWNEKRKAFMYYVLRRKFADNPDLMEKLRAIKTDIVEDNTWHDYYWGICNGEGLNVLGQLLMIIRDNTLNDEDKWA